MKKYIFLAALLTFSWGCNDEKFLTREPKSLLLDEQVFKDKTLVLSVVVDLYNGLPEYQSIKNNEAYGDLDEAMLSNNGVSESHRNTGWGYGAWAQWNYAYIRSINVFIQRCTEAKSLIAADQARFLAEGRFLRAAVYFEHVKSMGGVPLITEPLTYDLSGDPSYLQKARAKESEVYDFIIKELQEIESSLPNDVNEKNRATQGLVLAMQSRVALYAASIAKYGALRTPSVILPGGEVGIPASMATKYYETSLAAAKKLIGMNTYALYMKESPTLEERYSKIFYDKSGNPEVIFAEDFKLKSGKTIPFTILNQPFAGTEEPGDAGRVNPTLNLVQSFEKLDNTFAPLTKTNANDLLVDENNELLVFDQPQDLFAGRDARLGGTIILPGTKFKGKEVDIWAGWMVPATNKIYDASAPGNQGVDPLPGKTVREQSIGGSGPVLSFFRAAQTGFYLRKYLDPTPGSGQRGSGSEVWWIRYRYAEVLLNAAEAAFELGQGADATDYINQVRRRAGFKTDLIPAEVTFNRIAHERKVELAFEGHELWDYKRWRIADIVWDGSRNDLTSMPGDIMQPSTRPFALWPFKVYDQADPDHKNQKWVFKRVLWDQLSGADRFALGNYYSEISNEVINRNPKIVRNPNQ